MTAAPADTAAAMADGRPADALRVEGIAKKFGALTALRNVNLHLAKGEVLGLIGDNGAGKSNSDQDPLRFPPARLRPDPRGRR